MSSGGWLGGVRGSLFIARLLFLKTKLNTNMTYPKIKFYILASFSSDMCFPRANNKKVTKRRGLGPRSNFVTI